MNLPSFIILPCPECAKPLAWLQSEGHPGFVVCEHCGGMFDVGLVSAVAFSERLPRRPGEQDRSKAELEQMKEARERRAQKKRKPTQG